MMIINESGACGSIFGMGADRREWGDPCNTLPYVHNKQVQSHLKK